MQNPTLPFRPGDRVQTMHRESGTVVEFSGNRMKILLDTGRLITASVFDVHLLPFGTPRSNAGPART